MTELKKSTWEEKKIEETWKDGKKFWEMIRELVGKNKRKEEETYVYTEEGGKREIMKYIREYMGEWKKNVYQKYENTDFIVARLVDDSKPRRRQSLLLFLRQSLFLLYLFFFSVSFFILIVHCVSLYAEC